MSTWPLCFCQHATSTAACLQERLRGSEWAAVAVAAAGVMVLGASAQVGPRLQCCLSRHAVEALVPARSDHSAGWLMTEMPCPIAAVLLLAEPAMGYFCCPIGHVLQDTASAMTLQPSLLTLNSGLAVRQSAHSVWQAKLSELCCAAMQGADAEQWAGFEACSS